MLNKKDKIIGSIISICQLVNISIPLFNLFIQQIAIGNLMYAENCCNCYREVQKSK